MLRVMLLSVSLLFLGVQAPAAARDGDNAKSSSSEQQCAPKKKKRGGFLGSMAGALAGAGFSRVGVPSGIAGVSLPVASLLTEAIASRLDCKEQVQAATATTEATRGGVGTTASWESETRANVSGSSTVLAQNTRTDGSSCMTVNDVIIVGGEETTVPKTMCRARGSGSYVLAA